MGRAFGGFWEAGKFAVFWSARSQMLRKCFSVSLHGLERLSFDNCDSVRFGFSWQELFAELPNY
jgi:hypothetical protein